jgi:DNA repair photolyase
MKEFKSFYKEVDKRKFNTWCKWSTRLDTYGIGCAHDCKYCYAKSLLNFRGLWDPVNPAVADIEKIRRKIADIPSGSVVRLGGMTDCFQDCEKTYRVTYDTIKALNERGIHYLIVTKSDLIAEDEYIEILDKKLAHIQITVTTTDDNLSQSYENAPVSSRRVQAIEKLQALGYDVSVRLSPFIPEFIDVDKINAIRCDKILIEFLKVNSWVKKWFDIDYSEYTLKHGGYYHLPLERKIELVDKITGFKEISVGEYVKDHHEYFRDNVNHNKNDCCNLKIFN